MPPRQVTSRSTGGNNHQPARLAWTKGPQKRAAPSGAVPRSVRSARTMGQPFGCSRHTLSQSASSPAAEESAGSGILEVAVGSRDGEDSGAKRSIGVEDHGGSLVPGAHTQLAESRGEMAFHRALSQEQAPGDS